MTRAPALRPAIWTIALLTCLLAAGPAAAVTTYGTLDNFDVINDTGGECHGFEIELEGITSSDVAYTFGAPYQRYGDPTIVSTGTSVIIRYAAVYASGVWSATTPIAVAPYPPTQGHSCWTGGDPNYLASGCDHFGASLNATPTKTTYRWLVESTPGSGTLTAFGSNVPLPAPVWNVTPPADPAVNQPIAAAVIAPPPSANPDMCGEAMWAKVYVTELQNGLQAEDLDHMVIDDPNVNIVPSEPIEIEFEWVLLQACPGNAGEQEFGGAAEVGANSEAVSRRFEFYKYTGQYDPDPGGINEALCDNPTALDQQLPLSNRCGAPDPNGVAGVGALIGAQNVAINLAGPVPVNNPPTITDSKPAAVGMSENGSPTGFSLTLNATDPDADTLTWSILTAATHGTASASGTGSSKAIGYTPAAHYHGSDTFVVQISDGRGGTDTITVNVTINNDAPIANAGPDQSVRMHDAVTLNGSASSDANGDALTYAWSIISTPAHSKAALTGATTVSPTFVADKAGTYVVQLVVNDGTVNSAPATVTITATKGKK